MTDWAAASRLDRFAWLADMLWHGSRAQASLWLTCTTHHVDRQHPAIFVFSPFTIRTKTDGEDNDAAGVVVLADASEDHQEGVPDALP